MNFWTNYIYLVHFYSYFYSCVQINEIHWAFIHFNTLTSTEVLRDSSDVALQGGLQNLVYLLHKIVKFISPSKVENLIRLVFLVGHLYLSSVWFSEDIKEIGVHAQNVTTILG